VGKTNSYKIWFGNYMKYNTGDRGAWKYNIQMDLKEMG
jgi:hypothetical protein